MADAEVETAPPPASVEADPSPHTESAAAAAFVEAPAQAVSEPIKVTSINAKHEDTATTTSTSSKTQEIYENSYHHDGAADVKSTLTGKGSSYFDDIDVDRDYTTRLLTAAGGFTSSVRENILTHPVVLKNRADQSSASTHISAESRSVMRKGFDMGISSPGLRMLYDVRIPVKL